MNGFNFGFIKFCWDFLKDDILLIVNDFATSDKWPRGRMPRLCVWSVSMRIRNNFVISDLFL